MILKNPEEEFLLSGKDKLTLLGRMIIPWAIRYRNDLVLKYLTNEQSHLDLGCGKGYLVLHSPAQFVIGLDKTGGFKIDRRVSDKIQPIAPVDIEEGLPFENDIFDVVTCIAVIEHLRHIENVFSEVYRVLRFKGKFVITTPKGFVDKLLPFLDRGSSQLSGHDVRYEHKIIFSKEKFINLIAGKFKLKEYVKFQLGLNQLCILEKEVT